MKRQYSASTGKSYHPGRSAERNTKEGANHWKVRQRIAHILLYNSYWIDKQTDTHTVIAAKLSLSIETRAAPIAGWMNLNPTKGREEERGSPLKRWSCSLKENMKLERERGGGGRATNLGVVTEWGESVKYGGLSRPL